MAKVETYESLLAKKENFAKRKEDLQKELRAVRNTGIYYYSLIMIFNNYRF